MDADKLDRRTVSPLWEADEQYIDILLGPERTRECFLEGSNDNVQARSYRGWFLHGNRSAGATVGQGLCVV